MNWSSRGLGRGSSCTSTNPVDELNGVVEGWDEIAHVPVLPLDSVDKLTAEVKAGMR
jgi:hypothetical protein